MFRTYTAALLATTLAAGPAAAQQSLSEVGYVTEGLIAVGIAYEISEVCGDIDPRTLRGLAYLNQLRSHAKGLAFRMPKSTPMLITERSKIAWKGLPARGLPGWVPRPVMRPLTAQWDAPKLASNRRSDTSCGDRFLSKAFPKA